MPHSKVWVMINRGRKRGGGGINKVPPSIPALSVVVMKPGSYSDLTQGVTRITTIRDSSGVVYDVYPVTYQTEQVLKSKASKVDYVFRRNSPEEPFTTGIPLPSFSSPRPSPNSNTRPRPRPIPDLSVLTRIKYTNAELISMRETYMKTIRDNATSVTEDILFGFWEPEQRNGEFSNWWRLSSGKKQFEYDGERFYQAESALFYAKTKCCYQSGPLNQDALEKFLIDTESPNVAKDKKNKHKFDEPNWTDNIMDEAMYNILVAKYTQNSDKINIPEDKFIVEASPSDVTFGIGAEVGTPEYTDPKQWSGKPHRTATMVIDAKNVLGSSWMILRDTLKKGEKLDVSDVEGIVKGILGVS